MKRPLLAAILIALTVAGVGVAAVASSPRTPVSDLEYVVAGAGDTYATIVADRGLSCTGTQLSDANGRSTVRAGFIVFIPPSCVVPATTTTTTLPATTTTQPPAGGPQFVETFATAASLDRIGSWVYHRNVDLYDFGSFSGGSWQGDHDLACGTPDTSRTLSWDRTKNQDVRRSNSLYWCPNATGHFMTSMGDVDGFSIVAVWPKQIFPSVRSVCADVSLADLGNRQWLKFGVVSTGLFDSANAAGVPGFIMSDVGASDVQRSMVGPDHLLATWSGGISAGYPGFLKVGDQTTAVQSNPSPTDKMTRHPVCLVDNGDGTVTFTVAGVSVTRPGVFPAGPVRVVLYQNAYTPSKSETGAWGTTFHWDNLIVT